ncbi:hypothetical protein R1sor_020706 [Riccia sorocarpa]|uniref:polynucleotide adenylyltransferase n=1 Tax=Riccia sorocarpa TaxID=122646 RepID=A0ABD3GI42_9MARC
MWPILLADGFLNAIAAVEICSVLEVTGSAECLLFLGSSRVLEIHELEIDTEECAQTAFSTEGIRVVLEFHPVKDEKIGLVFELFGLRYWLDRKIQVAGMTTEVAENPAILYDTYGTLGDDYDEDSRGLPSYAFPLDSPDREATGNKNLNLANGRGESDEAQASHVLEDEEKRGTGAVLKYDEQSPLRVTEEQTDVSTSIADVAVNGASGDGTEARVSTSIEDEEIGFLSLESEVPGAEYERQVPAADDQDLTLLSGVNNALKEAPPWARTRAIHGTWFKSPFLQLHQEIVDFCDFVTPTENEQRIRDEAVQRVTEVVLSIWPSCQVKVFGSFATGLYLPTSDIDMVILESGCQAPQVGLKALGKALNRKNLVKKLQVIGKARVPIVKFVESGSSIPFDISFDVANGPEAAEFIKGAMNNFPPLKPLCMVLKMFLQQRELNEVYTGGIGSYALLVMLLTHLQTHPSRKSFNRRGEPCPLENNLGILLVDFFDFYGRALNVKDVGISCRTGGRFYSKRSRGFVDNGRPYLLSVEDPQKPDNDIGKNSYNVMKIRSAFILAHRLLTKLEVEDVPEHVGLLGRIVRLDKELTRREFALADPPPWTSPANPSSSSGFLRERETPTPGLHQRLRWHQDEDFPRGGELDKMSRKRKRALDRAARAAANNDSERASRKRKRGETSLGDGNPGPSAARGKKSKHGGKKRERERLELVAKQAERRKARMNRMSTQRGDNPSPGVEVQEQSSSHSKKSNSKRSKSRRREGSREEGEIILEDDSTFREQVGNGRDHAEGETTGGVDNGTSRHRRWFRDLGTSADRPTREQQRDGPVGEEPGTQEVRNEAGNSSRKVLVTSAHKKVTYT